MRLSLSRVLGTAPLLLAVGCSPTPPMMLGTGGSGGAGAGSGMGGTGSQAVSTGATTISVSASSGATTTSTASTGSGIDPCAPIPGATYTSLGILGSPTTNPPAAMHPDINIKLRGWEPTGGTLGFVSYSGPTDTNAPRLNTLYPDGHIPAFTKNYQVNDWNWTTMMPAGPITSGPVTMTDFAATPGEVLDVPSSGYQIAPGLEVHVLYADSDSIVFKYTGEDNVIYGYTIHLFGICVEPSLLSLYQQDNAAGRSKLPALASQQAFGRARGNAVSVVIRDTGTFMDPRSKKDWWP
jgi:hypothetical protein